MWFLHRKQHVPGTDAVSVRTSNRNFKGRSGTPSANVYLTSPVVAAAAAIRGEFIDPQDLGMEFPRIGMPERFEIDDSMIISPRSPDERAKVQIFRGPNIGEPPRNMPMPDSIKGIVSIKVEDNITTDHIMPAGSRLKYRSNVPKYSTFVFEPLDADFSRRAAELRDKGMHNVIVAGLSYGQGSSREHAAMCPMYLGVKAVIAKSIERIHAANLVNFGIVPLYFVRDSDYELIEPGMHITIPGIRKAIESGESETKAIIGDHEIPLRMELSRRQRDILIAGGLLPYTVKSR